MTSRFRLYQDLEILPPRRTRPSLRIQLSTGIRYLSSQLVKALTTGNEPKVRKIQIKNGQSLYDIYDPVTHEHIQAVSEEEVYIFLDNRYNTI